LLIKISRAILLLIYGLYIILVLRGRGSSDFGLQLAIFLLVHVLLLQSPLSPIRPSGPIVLEVDPETGRLLLIHVEVDSFAVDVALRVQLGLELVLRCRGEINLPVLLRRVIEAGKELLKHVLIIKIFYP
jgi:hypothetical protein